jgi:hypothetical protein
MKIFPTGTLNQHLHFNKLLLLNWSQSQSTLRKFKTYLEVLNHLWIVLCFIRALSLIKLRNIIGHFVTKFGKTFM